MANYGKIINVLAGLLKDSPAVLQSGMDVVEVATELFSTIGKEPSQVSDADLDRLAAASDAAHREVQQPIRNDET